MKKAFVFLSFAVCFSIFYLSCQKGNPNRIARATEAEDSVYLSYSPLAAPPPPPPPVEEVEDSSDLKDVFKVVDTPPQYYIYLLIL